MSYALEIRLLGHPEIRLQGKSLETLLPFKAIALLAYLTLAEQPVGRETIATLLWPDAEPQAAKHSLRNLLSQFNKVCGGLLNVNHRTVGLLEPASQQIDVVDFLQGLTTIQQAQKRKEAPDLALWQAKLDLYRGDFLTGLHVHQTAPFEEWLTVRREYLRKLLIHNLLTLSEAYAAKAEHKAALACLDRLLEMEPQHEVAYSQQIQLLFTLGRRTEALQRYERYQQMLATEFNVPPAPELSRLVAKLRNQASGAAPTPSTQELLPPQSNKIILRPPAFSSSPPVFSPPTKKSIPNNLAHPLTLFVGRGPELETIVHRLTTTACRLLTIVGIGGVGKTSLAQEAAQRILQSTPSEFADGIYFVPLLNVGREQGSVEAAYGDESEVGEAILRAIATQIGYRLADGTSSALRLQNHLRTKRLLLILDNFEHLLAGVDAIVTLLTQTPHVKALVTSRSRLNVRGESVLTLNALSLPSFTHANVYANIYTNIYTDVHANNSAPAPHYRYETWQASEAVTMFVQRAQQIDPTFAMTAETIAPVIQICQQVEGLPLAIELATSMLPILSCSALAEALTRNLTFLAAETRDLPNEQRTLGAVFERSWRLLPANAQRLLARLTIFPGSFSSEAAEQVAGASDALLRRLLDQSLLSQVGDERYAMHRTVHFFAQQKLQQLPEEIAMLQIRYAHFYLELMARMEQALIGAAYGTAIEQIQTDLDNVQTAWRWAITYRMTAELNHCLHALHLFSEQHRIYVDVIHLYEEALHHFSPELTKSPQPAHEETILLVGRLSAMWASRCGRLGRFQQAQAAFESSWSILQQVEDPVASLFCLGSWAEFLKRNDLKRAVELLREALGLSDRVNQKWMKAILHQLLGEIDFLFGNYAEAEAQIIKGRDIAKQLTWTRGLASAYKSLGRVRLSQGNYHQAEAQLQEGVAFARQHHLNLLCLEGTIALSEALRIQGRIADARVALQASRKLVEELGAGLIQAPLLWEEGALAEQCGEYLAAKILCSESLEIGLPAWWSHALPTLGWALIGLGELEEAGSYLQKISEEANAQGRLPISLDAQVGLMYIQWLSAWQRSPESQVWVEKNRTELHVIYQHPATSAETRQRIHKISNTIDQQMLERFGLGFGSVRVHS